MSTETADTVTATVVTPRHVEVDGRLYTAVERDEADERLWLKECRQRTEFHARIDASGDPALRGAWDRLQTADREWDEAKTTALLRFVGKFLIDEQRRDLWRLLYLELRHTDLDAVADRIMEVLLKDAESTDDDSRAGEYRENDEMLFALGPKWRMYLDEDEDEDEEEGA